MRYLDLLEQIELVEAARDKYLPMFNFIEQLQPLPGASNQYNTRLQGLKKGVPEHVDWAVNTLRNADRVVWFVRLTKLMILTGLYESLEEEVKAQSTHAAGLPDWGKMVSDEDKLQASQQTQVLNDLTRKVGNLLKKELMKYQNGAAAEIEKELQDTAQKREVLGKKLGEMETRCQQNPEHQDCGNTRTDVRTKFRLLQALEAALGSGKGQIRAPTHQELRAIMQKMTHFESIGYEPMQDYRFGWKPPATVTTTLETLENIWAERQKRTIVHDDAESEIQKVLDYGKKGAWFNLKRPQCDREGVAMGHCGNQYENMRQTDELLSFRTPEGKDPNGHEIWKPHLTFVFDTTNGFMGEMKGNQNTKPTAEFHPVIVDLLKQDWVKGIVKRPHQYQKQNDFYISDLPREEAQALAQEKPGLLTFKDRRALGIEGDMSEMELEKVNEQLHDWGVQEIESQNGDTFVLESWDNEERAYEDLSGASWPSEGDIDYPDDDQKKEIYAEFSDDFKKLFLEWTYLHYREETMEYLEVEEGEGFTALDARERLDMDDAMEILDSAGESDPFEDTVDEAWKKYHAGAMQDDAGYRMNDYIYEGSGEYDFEYQKLDDDTRAITMNVDYFFDEVFPGLENTDSGRYGTNTWPSILQINIGDTSEYYWETWADAESENLAYISEEVEKELIKGYQDDIEKMRISGKTEADELQSKQMGLGLDEPEQPEGGHKGAERLPHEKKEMERKAKLFKQEDKPPAFRVEVDDRWYQPSTGLVFRMDDRWKQIGKVKPGQ